jgi:hypothetical protein
MKNAGKNCTKVAGKYAEAARVAIRNIRRDGMDSLKKMEKDGEISEDRHHALSDEVQKLTDDLCRESRRCAEGQGSGDHAGLMSREPAPASEGAGAQGLPGPQHVAIIMDGNGRWAKAGDCRARQAMSAG